MMATADMENIISTTTTVQHTLQLHTKVPPMVLPGFTLSQSQL